MSYRFTLCNLNYFAHYNNGVLHFIYVCSDAKEICRWSTLIIRTMLDRFNRTSTLYTCTQGRRRIIKDIFTSVRRRFSLNDTCRVRRLFIYDPVLQLFRCLFRRPFTINVFHRLRVIQTFIKNRYRRSRPNFLVSRRQFRTIFARVQDSHCNVRLSVIRREAYVRFKDISSIPTLYVYGSGLIKVIFARMDSDLFRQRRPFCTWAFVRNRIQFVDRTMVNYHISGHFIRYRSQVFF